MPLASAAASSPPIARSCRPNRVVITQRPNRPDATSNAKEVGSKVEPDVSAACNPAGTSPPGTGNTTSATPSHTDIVASVTTIGDSLKRAISNPLRQPAISPAASTAAIAGATPNGNKTTASEPLTDMIGPSDRSTPRTRTT